MSCIIIQVLYLKKFLNLPKNKNLFYNNYNLTNDKDMKIETRNMLIEYFRPHNEKLYKLIGQKFDWDK